MIPNFMVVSIFFSIGLGKNPPTVDMNGWNSMKWIEMVHMMFPFEEKGMMFRSEAIISSVIVDDFSRCASLLSLQVLCPWVFCVFCRGFAQKIYACFFIEFSGWWFSI